MAKKKKVRVEKIVISEPTKQKKIILLRPREWAKSEGIDPQLFVYWNDLVTKEEYLKIKQKVYRG